MQTFSSDFILEFNLGDNINYNLRILKALYKIKNSEACGTFNKPIIILNMSIIEAVLHDFFRKPKVLTREGMNLSDEKKEEILGVKKLNNFGELKRLFVKILVIENYDLDKNMEDLINLRNRIHIRNKKNHFERKDSIAFSESKIQISEELLEIVMKVMSKEHLRFPNSVKDFVLPFDEHFANLQYNTEHNIFHL